MKLFFLKLFTWWNGQTFGTQLWTWRFGELVGKDEQGNLYYRTKGGEIDPSLGFQRRWVIYNGYAEATRVPPSWHGWLHHTVDVAPTEESYTPREWEKPHVPNMTGTPAAYRPSGSTLASGRRPAATGDYQPWTPGTELIVVIPGARSANLGCEAHIGNLVPQPPDLPLRSHARCARAPEYEPRDGL